MPALLYSGDAQADLVCVLVYLEEWAEAREIKALDIDLGALASLIRDINHGHDFPHADGLEGASVFKKAACFVCYFIAHNPIKSPFPAGGDFSDELLKLKNHQNAVIALELAIDSLDGAVVQRKSGDVVLANRIAVSRHSYLDIVDALRTISPVAHFKLVSVLLEQLAYRANPEASYPVDAAQ